MDPVAAAASLIALLIPFAKKTVESFAGEIGKAAYQKAKQIVDGLRERFGDDAMMAGALGRFEEDPEGWASTLQKLIEEKAQADGDFLNDLVKQLGDLEKEAPDITVVQNMKEARNATGLHADHVSSGSILVEQNVGQAENVTGVRIGTLGKREKPTDG